MVMSLFILILCDKFMTYDSLSMCFFVISDISSHVHIFQHQTTHILLCHYVTMLLYVTVTIS